MDRPLLHGVPLRPKKKPCVWGNPTDPLENM